jgi:hypothetical protein
LTPVPWFLPGISLGEVGELSWALLSIFLSNLQSYYEE